MTEPYINRCPLCGETSAANVVSFPQLAFVRCQCGLVYKQKQDPSIIKNYETTYFEKGRAQYLSRWGHRVRKCRRQLLATLEFAPQARDVLDIGCSAGYVLEAAKQLELSAVGVDVSEFAVRECQSKGYSAKVGELVRLPFADASFDIITAKHTLEHTPEPRRALAEMHRVLRPHGVVLLVVPDVDHWKGHFFPRWGPHYRPERLGWQHAVYYSDRSLAASCAAERLIPMKAGKGIFRRRLAVGLRAPFEALRFATVVVWNTMARWLRLRREIQLIAARAD